MSKKEPDETDSMNASQDTSEEALAALTTDLQRVQADFINYRNRTEDEHRRQSHATKAATIVQLLPLLDDIERAVSHLPTELQDNQWAKGVAALPKQLDRALESLGVTRINALDEPFDPQLHEAVQMEDGEGEHEVVTEVLRTGYRMDEQVLRPSLVKVGRA